MIIEKVLSAEQCKNVHTALGTVRWIDGKSTAGAVAGAVKDNEQVDLKEARGAQLAQELSIAIGSHMTMRAAALPKRVSALRISRTQKGGHYGVHFDNALMPAKDGIMRTDLSFTLFLSAPDSYDGGELVVYDSQQEMRHKLPAGDLVLYPSGALHEVTPVTRGARIACVGWVQSVVSRADQRTALWELHQLSKELQKRLGVQDKQTRLAQKIYADLVRQFSEI
ncbi:MAG: Fe2+-dependent dioxygenase [Pseudomonadota bacterium]